MVALLLFAVSPAWGCRPGPTGDCERSGSPALRFFRGHRGRRRSRHGERGLAGGGSARQRWHRVEPAAGYHRAWLSRGGGDHVDAAPSADREAVAVRGDHGRGPGHRGPAGSCEPLRGLGSADLATVRGRVVDPVASGGLGGEYTGQVVGIGLTYTELMTDEGRFSLPNAAVLAAATGPRPHPEARASKDRPTTAP